MKFLLALGLFVVSVTASLSPSRTVSKSSVPSHYTYYGSNSTISASTSTNGSFTTVNVVNATLNWWYKPLATSQALTISMQYDTDDTYTGWTIYSDSTTYDVSTAIAPPTHFPYITTYPTRTYTWTSYSSIVLTEAASTSEVIIRAYLAPTASTGTGRLPNLRITPAPAIATVGTKTFSSATPFVCFSQYELVSRKCSNGTCSPATRSFQLSTPYAFPYTQSVPTSQPFTVSGKLDAAFPASLNRTSLIAGSYEAITVVIVVVEEVAVAVAVLAATTLAPQSSLDLPTAILPTYFSQLPPITDRNVQSPTSTSGPRILTTQSWLLVPPPQTVLPQTAQMNDLPTSTAGNQQTTPQPQQLTTVKLSPEQSSIAHALGLTPLVVTAIIESSTTKFLTGNSAAADSVRNKQSMMTAFYAGSQTLYPGAQPTTIGKVIVSVATQDGSLHTSVISPGTSSKDAGLSETTTSPTAGQPPTSPSGTQSLTPYLGSAVQQRSSMSSLFGALGSMLFVLAV